MDVDGTERILEALGSVADPCCRERGISVVDMGLVRSVEVDAGEARVDLMLTSGWCPFQVDLVGEITAAVEAVPGVASAQVRITLDEVWSTQRLSPDARRKLRLLPDPGDVADRAGYVATLPLASVDTERKAVP